MAITLDPIKSKLVRDIVDKVQEQRVSKYREAYSMAREPYGLGSIDTSHYQLIRMSRFEGPIPEVPNKMDVSPTLTPPEPKPFTATSRDFRLKFVYLEDDAADDQVGYYEFNAAALGEGADLTRELMAMEPFNRALDPTFTSGWDNLTLGNNAHQLENGGLYSNLLPAAAPSEALLEQVKNYFARIPTAGGWPVQETDFTIVCSESYARRWAQILNADTAIAHPFNPGSEPNQNPAIPNLFVAEGGRIKIVGTPYLEHEDWQFFLAKGNELAMKERWYKNYTYRHDDPEGMAHVVKLRLLNFWGDARRILVSAEV